MKKLLPLFISLTLGTASSLSFAADTLKEVYEQAKNTNPALLSAQAQKDAAFEAISSARSTLLPQINLTAGYNITRSDIDNPQTGSRESDKLTAGIAVSQELYKRSSWVSLDVAEKTARQEDAAYAAAEQQLILDVATAYFAVLSAEDNVKFVQAEKAAVSRQLEQTKQRFKVGLSAITDVHDAQAQYDSVLADELVAKNNVINSYEGLRTLTGRQYSDLYELDTKRFSATKESRNTDELIKQAEQKNLSLLSSRIAQDIARDAITQAKSGYLPSLTLDGGYNHGRDFHDHAGPNNGEYNDVYAGINLNISLYAGGNTASLTEQAKFNYVSASENLETAHRSVLKDVRAFNNNITSSIGVIRAYEQSVVSAKSALEANEAGFDVGTRTIVDVLESTRRLYDANKSLSNARYDYILNVMRLRLALGTLSEQDIIDINNGLMAKNSGAAKAESAVEQTSDKSKS